MYFLFTKSNPSVPPSIAASRSPVPAFRGPFQAPPRAAPVFREKLLGSLSKAIPFNHLSVRTEQTYRGWALRFLSILCAKNGGAVDEDLKGFLSSLAVERKVSAATQRQAFNGAPFSLSSCDRDADP
jgi:hypothetical protein